MIYMDHSSAQHHQEMSCHQTVESMLVCSNKAAAQDSKKPKPPEESLKCPRCESSNTKFCYYNNYSLTQPRYFCKSCRRYWTKGGTLRNVPVGGGCRKNRRSSSSSSSSRIRIQDHHQPPFINIQGNPGLLSAAYDSTDLSLAFARLQNGQLGFDHYQNHDQLFSNMNAAGGHNYNDAHGYLNAAGFLENPYQNVSSSSYYNIGNPESTVEDQMGNLPYEDLMNGGQHATTQAVTVTTVKHEGTGGSQPIAAEGVRAFWEYPWQLNGGGGDNVDGAMRQSSSWITGINGASANWHGLMNSTTLMQGDVN